MIHIQNSHRQLRWSMPQAYPNRIDWRVHSSGPCCHWSPECHTTEGTPSDRLCRYGFGPGVWRWHWGPTRDCWHSAGLHRVGRLHEENPDIIPIHVNNCQWNPQQRRGQPSHIADKQLMYHILLYHWYHLQINTFKWLHPSTHKNSMNRLLELALHNIPPYSSIIFWGFTTRSTAPKQICKIAGPRDYRDSFTFLLVRHHLFSPSNSQAFFLCSSIQIPIEYHPNS